MPQRRPKRRLRRYSEGNDSEFARLKARLRRLSVPCPRCSSGDDPWEDVTQACVICEDTGRIDAWHALPVLESDGLDRPPYSSDDAKQVRLLKSRLDASDVKCPYCRGTGRAARDHPCPVCEREGTMSAWESATLMMVPCPHCQGYGSGGAPGMGWDCVFCRTAKEVALAKAVGYSPEWVRECDDSYSAEQLWADFRAFE
jgi:RecJ-like exonuclease